MEENYLNISNNEEYENDIFYNGNEVKNYEEQACCNNIFFSNFANNNIFSYINDICFKDIPINEEELIHSMNQEFKTPFHSKKKKWTPKDIIINNENNDINLMNQNQSNNSVRNSLVSNPSNESAAEPIIPLRRNNTAVINKENNGIPWENREKSIFTNLANIFKKLFVDKNNNNNEDLSDKQSIGSSLSFSKRPILRRLFTNDEGNNNKKNKNKINDNNSQSNIRKSYKEKRREKVFDEILTLKTSENNDENIINLVSAIPAFIVKEKNKIKNNNNKYCHICLGEFRVGEKESVLPCLHLFHFNCIEKWLKRNKLCPVCKLQKSLESLNPDF